MSARRIDAVVFDFGGVLITTINNQVGDVAATHGVELAVMHEVLLPRRPRHKERERHRAERGELDVADIQSELGPWAADAGVDLRGDEIQRLMRPGAYTVIGEVLDLIDALRGDGFGTALLTNTFAEFRPTMERDIDFALFDVVVESFAVGARKPEPAIYEATAEQLGVRHDAIVYLDDFDQNLEPAAALGWTTILVGDHRDAIIRLDGLLERSRYDEK